MKLNEELKAYIVRVILPVDYETHQGTRLLFFGKIEVKQMGGKTYFQVAREGQSILFSEEAIVSQSLLTKTIVLQDGEHVAFSLAKTPPNFGATWS